MLLVIDVGNTNIVLGVYDKKNLVGHWRISTDRVRTTDEYGMLMMNLFFHDRKVNAKDIKAIIISSVVPPLMPTLERVCLRYFNVNPLIVGPGSKTGIAIKYDNPREVGADRIVNAVAANAVYKGPLIIIDFGTATTYSTHLIEDVEPVLDEAVFLKNGRIFAHRSVDELRETEGMSVDAYFREVFKC